MGQRLRFPIVTLLINYILSLVTGADRFHSQRTKPGSVLCHPAAPAGIPYHWASSCEGSLGHQEISPAGTFLRVCARDTTSVSLLRGDSSCSAQSQPQFICFHLSAAKSSSVIITDTHIMPYCPIMCSVL